MISWRWSINRLYLRLSVWWAVKFAINYSRCLGKNMMSPQCPRWRASMQSARKLEARTPSTCTLVDQIMSRDDYRSTRLQHRNKILTKKWLAILNSTRSPSLGSSMSLNRNRNQKKVLILTVWQKRLNIVLCWTCVQETAVRPVQEVKKEVVMVDLLLWDPRRAQKWDPQEAIKFDHQVAPKPGHLAEHLPWGLQVVQKWDPLVAPRYDLLAESTP